MLIDTHVQSMIARTVAGFLSDKLDTEVKIKTFYVKPDMSLYAEDVLIEDKNNNPMLAIGKLKMKLSAKDIRSELNVRAINLDDVLCNFVTYENEKTMNLLELFSVSKDKDHKTKKELIPIIVDKLSLNNAHIVVWNQNKDNANKRGMDYHRIDIDGIDLDISDMIYKNDSILAYLDFLKARDRCGFTIDTLHAKSKLLVCPTRMMLDNFVLKTHASSLDMDLEFSYNNYKAFKKFVDSINISANIRPSQFTLSDIRFFSATMGKMTDTLKIEGIVNGSVSNFTAKNFKFAFKDSTSFDGDIMMKGLPKFFNTYIEGDVRKMTFSYDDIAQFAIPTPTRKIPLPEFLSSIKFAELSGTYKGYHNNYTALVDMKTNLGGVNVNCTLNKDLITTSKPSYSMIILTDSLNVKDLIKTKDDLILSMNTKIVGEGLSKESADFNLNINIEYLRALNNDFNDISLCGVYENARLIASTKVISNVLKADLNALADFADVKPEFDINLDINKADLYRLNLLKKDNKQLLSTNIKATVQGSDVDNMTGNIYLENTNFTDSRGSYHMNDLYVSLSDNQFDMKDLNVNCDFFDLNASGIINFSKLPNTFKNYVLNYFHVNKWTERNVKLEENNLDFYVNVNLKNTQTLSRLLMPDLYVSENTNLTATFTTKNHLLYSRLESDSLMYKGLKFNNIHVSNKTDVDKVVASLSMEDFTIKDKNENNADKSIMENILLGLDIHNDSLFLAFDWDDMIIEDKNKGNITASFVADDDFGGMLRIASSGITINDTIWNLNPECFVDFQRNKTIIHALDLYTKAQRVSLNGKLPNRNQDTLYMNFDRLGLYNLDLITSGLGVKLDGIVDGNVQIAGLKQKFTFLSNLDIQGLSLDNYLIGNAILDAEWNAPDTSIFIDTELFSLRNNIEERILLFNGNYYTARENDNLDFDILLNGIDISFVNPFTKGLVSRIKGALDGDISLVGSLKKPVFNGNVLLTDAACQIDYLNTYYRINDTKLSRINNNNIVFSKNKIEIQQLNLNDTLDNEAIARGVIVHDYLKDFVFDIDILLNNFIGLNMKADESSSFYGTAIADGDVKISGPIDDISLNINAETKSGTEIDIVLTETSTVNDNFIVFIQKQTEQDTIQTIVPEVDKSKKFTLDLNANVTQDAKVNIHLPSNLGSIDAKGDGNIRLGLATNGLTLYGDYIINNGTFNFNFQNFIRRNFTLNGGSITWSGNAADADIDVTGSYRTKSSISSLGVEIDSTSLVNNVSVDCIIHLKNKLTNPNITFGMSLPNATDDIKSTVFTIIDTTNQALLSQQIISLLVLGSFSYSTTTLNTIGASTYYGVITSSLSSWLSQISKDFDVGVRYTPKDNITAEELEVALSTQLFDDRLTIEGNLGMYTDSRQNMAQNANNIVGDVDITFKVTNRLSLKAYNHSNFNSNYYSYTYETYSDYTQGIGISYSQSFDSLKEIFTRKNRNKKNKKVNRNE